MVQKDVHAIEKSCKPHFQKNNVENQKVSPTFASFFFFFGSLHGQEDASELTRGKKGLTESDI